MIKGSSPTDGGFLLLSESEMNDFLRMEPGAVAYIRRYVGSDEYINGISRFCFWLKFADPLILRNLPYLMERLQKVQKFRQQSKKLSTRNWNDRPSQFIEDRQPTTDYLLIPRVSSENRKYIPIGFFSPEYIVSDSAIALPFATIFHFGILTSYMHMVWVRHICGRLESRFRYSNTIVYNNFPWPEQPTEKQVQAIEQAAQGVLDARGEFPNSSLADLYDPLTMPPKLLKAHQTLDKAVDLAYRPQPFTTDAKRMEYLFELYEKYTAGMFGEGKKKSRRSNL